MRRLNVTAQMNANGGLPWSFVLSYAPRAISWASDILMKAGRG